MAAISYQRVRHPNDTHVVKLDEQVKNVVDQANRAIAAATPAGMVTTFGPGGAPSSLITPSSMQAGAAATNVGTLGRDLGGTLPNPNLARGTAFPGSPSTSQRFFRTDVGSDFYWTGTIWAPMAPEIIHNTADNASFSTVETIVAGGKTGGANSPNLSFQVPGGLLAVGSCVRVCVVGNCTTTVANAVSYRLRGGSNGTTADASLQNWGTTAGTASGGFEVLAVLKVAAIGASATFDGAALVRVMGPPQGTATTLSFALTGSNVAFNSTVANFFEFTMSSAAATTAFTTLSGTMEILV